MKTGNIFFVAFSALLTASGVGVLKISRFSELKAQGFVLKCDLHYSVYTRRVTCHIYRINTGERYAQECRKKMLQQNVARLPFKILDKGVLYK